MSHGQQYASASSGLYAGPTFLDVAKAPYRLGWAFLLAWVFCVFYLQVFGVTSGDALIAAGGLPEGLVLFFNAFPVFISVATLLAVIAAERRFGPPSAHPFFEIAMAGIAALGTPLLVVMTGDVASTSVVFGLASLLTGIGSGVMWVSWGEHYARIPQEDVEMFAPVSAVFGALLTLAVSSMSGWVSVAVVASFPLLSALCLYIARKEDEPRTSDASGKHDASPASLPIVAASMGRTLTGIMAACLFVCVAGALSEGRRAFDSSSVQLVLIASTVFTLAIAFISVVGPRRISISFFYRWMCPALVLGFAAIVLFGETAGSYLAFMMSIAARFAFCLITQMYFARVASEGTMTAVQSYGWGWVSVHLGDFLGVLATTCVGGLVADGMLSLEQVATMCMVALVVVTMFVIDDKRSFAALGGVATPTTPSCDSPLPHATTADCASNERPRVSKTQAAGPLRDKPEAKGAENDGAQAVASDATDASPRLDSPAHPSPAASLDERIERIAREHGLTPRESEVFAMLARGRSIPYVRDALVISRETAATHAKHIYAKLGVHSRQELIDLVAERKWRHPGNLLPANTTGAQTSSCMPPLGLIRSPQPRHTGHRKGPRWGPFPGRG